MIIRSVSFKWPCVITAYQLQKISIYSLPMQIIIFIVTAASPFVSIGLLYCAFHKNYVQPFMTFFSLQSLILAVTNDGLFKNEKQRGGKSANNNARLDPLICSAALADSPHGYE